jgi:hypothetical protein
MSHLKFISLPEAMTPKDFIDELKHLMNWQDDVLRDITLIHNKKLRNHRSHLRISFNKKKRIDEIKRKALRTTQQKVYSLRINDIQILFVELRNDEEKFKLKDTRNGTESSVLLIKMPRDVDLYGILKIINQLLRVNFIYVSNKSRSSFVKFANKRDMLTVFNYLKNQIYNVKISRTELQLIKNNVNHEEMTLNVTMVIENSPEPPRNRYENTGGNHLVEKPFFHYGGKFSTLIIFNRQIQLVEIFVVQMT